ncbi:hypothetical protein ACFWN1_12670 [Streptomyces sp. NPDC058459]|uniref:hypothetical protein n=1 Tax=Streptomyces sp. NPDC058459 TaxID=3346508 RepID=UPI00365C4D8D
MFNERDCAAAEQFRSPEYIQHSAHIAPGRYGLFDLVRSASEELRRKVNLLLASSWPKETP